MLQPEPDNPRHAFLWMMMLAVIYIVAPRLDSLFFLPGDPQPAASHQDMSVRSDLRALLSQFEVHMTQSNDETERHLGARIGTTHSVMAVVHAGIRLHDADVSVPALFQYSTSEVNVLVQAFGVFLATMPSAAQLYERMITQWARAVSRLLEELERVLEELECVLEELGRVLGLATHACCLCSHCALRLEFEPSRPRS